MKSTTISKLKARLSSHLQHVKKGEEVIVTDRGQPVARIIPFISPSAISPYLKEMVQEGLVRLGSGKVPASFWSLPHPVDPRGLAMAALMEERNQR